MQLRRHTLPMTSVTAPAACCQENPGEYGRLGRVLQFPKTQKDLKSNVCVCGGAQRRDPITVVI